MKGIVGHLDAQQWRPLLVQDVPSVEAAVHPRGEEDRGPGRAPAPVGQVFRVRAKTLKQSK